jgi:hypothetical protein
VKLVSKSLCKIESQPIDNSRSSIIIIRPITEEKWRQEGGTKVQIKTE